MTTSAAFSSQKQGSSFKGSPTIGSRQYSRGVYSWLIRGISLLLSTVFIKGIIVGIQLLTASILGSLVSVWC